MATTMHLPPQHDNNPIDMGGLLQALPPTQEAWKNDDDFPALGTEPKPNRRRPAVLQQTAAYTSGRQVPPQSLHAQRETRAMATRELRKGRQVGTVVTIKQNYAFVRPLEQEEGDHEDVFLHATDMHGGETWVDLWDRVSSAVQDYKDRTKCVNARR